MLDDLCAEEVLAIIKASLRKPTLRLWDPFYEELSGWRLFFAMIGFGNEDMEDCLCQLGEFIVEKRGFGLSDEETQANVRWGGGPVRLVVEDVVAMCNAKPFTPS